MNIRRLNDEGQSVFRLWLASRKSGESPPPELVDDNTLTEHALDVEIDSAKTFASRYEFGKYMTKLLDHQDTRALLSQKYDGLWDWLTIVYFDQFGRKVSKPWHYSVTRKGHAGSLAYRHLARTSFEMYWRHGPASYVMLQADMGTWGDLSEQLTSRQDVAYHRGYILAANKLYLSEGKPIPGAASRTTPFKRRKKGDRRGKGSVARLALAVRRLCRTFDTHALTTSQMIEILPKEFERFSKPNTGEAKSDASLNTAPAS